MGSEFKATTPQDHATIAGLLGRVFSIEPDHPNSGIPYQSWKYWKARDGWEGSRSYVLANGEAVLAHGAVWPMPLRGPGRNWKGIFLIDWASSPEAAAGVGILLLRRIAALGDAVCVIGGTAMTRAIMPKIGFRPYGELSFAARPLRPLRQVLSHQFRNWKLPARLLRNTAYRLRPLPAHAGWTARECSPREIDVNLWPSPTGSLTVGARDAALFEYFQQCPGISVRFYEARREGEPAGYFCLSIMDAQARIADAWVSSGKTADWAALYALAIDAAHRDGRAAEITAVHSLPEGLEALCLSGFRIVDKVPMQFLGKKEFLETQTAYHLQLIDSDLAFQHSGRPEYWT